MRVVLDTNVLVSAALRPASTAARAVTLAFHHAEVLLSDATFAELVDVLHRPKLARVVAPEPRDAFLRLVATLAVHIARPDPVIACRDPKDDAFLSLALAGGADVLVSGDHDLLVLHPFRGLTICSPTDFLARFDVS